jgi:hypothetical protein
VRSTEHHKEAVKLRCQEAVVTRHPGDTGKTETGSVSTSGVDKSRTAVIRTQSFPSFGISDLRQSRIEANVTLAALS